MKRTNGTRVLMLVENCSYPQDRRVKAEATALVDAGAHVTVIAPTLPGQLRHEIVAGVEVYRYPVLPGVPGALGFAWEYAYSLAASFVLSLAVFFRHGFNVVHAHNPPDLFVFIALFYKLFGARFVFDHHDLSPEMYDVKFGTKGRGPTYRLLVWLEKLSCRVADRVIAANESHMAVEIERSRVPRERITVVRNGPDLDLQPCAPDPGLRRRGRIILGFVGGMGDQDGVEYLLRALRHLACDLHREDFFCVLVGDGSAWPRARTLATTLGVESYVWFTGPLAPPSWLPYLSAADICVEPAPSNGYNDRSTTIKIMEYMALAKPIVAFDLPEHRVSAGDAACYVRPSDERAFAAALAELMDDPERRRRMGALGRQRIESTLAWPHSARNLLQCYQELFRDSPATDAAKRAARAPAGSRRQRWAWWIRERSAGYVARRSIALATRYGVTSPKAEQRVLDCVKALARHGCHPTFPIPGWILRRYREFSQTLQAMGAELAIHGYQHVDFRSLSRAEASQQFLKAAAAFQECGIQADGYRCPYLSGTEELKEVIPDGLVGYSSNRAIWWADAVPDGSVGTAIFENLRRFYRAESSDTVVSTPRLANGIVEIPCSLPDDLQLSDGLQLDAAGIADVWTDMLRHIHRRGELFVVLFHPESYEQCGQALEGILSAAERMRPGVWIAQLRDVSRWWQEKAGFGVAVGPLQSGGLRLRFNCSGRATVLVRHVHADAGSSEWFDSSYRVLNGRVLDVTEGVRPFVGLAQDVPSGIAAFLEEQGYILDRGDTARECGIYLDADGSSRRTEVQLVDHIESSPAPLVRFSRWPANARSALCVTGDLDALSLTDYLARVFAL
ncbi:MAG TPA: glycosyltransferase [Vicinamibacterales bacterium]